MRIDGSCDELTRGKSEVRVVVELLVGEGRAGERRRAMILSRSSDLSLTGLRCQRHSASRQDETYGSSALRTALARSSELTSSSTCAWQSKDSRLESCHGGLTASRRASITSALVSGLRMFERSWEAQPKRDESQEACEPSQPRDANTKQDPAYVPRAHGREALVEHTEQVLLRVLVEQLLGIKRVSLSLCASARPRKSHVCDQLEVLGRL